MLIQDISSVQQLFLNLMNPDVSGWMFSTVDGETNPFRFWLDRPEDISDGELDLATLNFKFFGISLNPVFAALRRRGLASLMCFGTMIPLSFASIVPNIAFRVHRLSYSQVSMHLTH